MGNRQLFRFVLKKWSGGPFFHEPENKKASYGPGPFFHELANKKASYGPGDTNSLGSETVREVTVSAGHLVLESDHVPEP